MKSRWSLWKALKGKEVGLGWDHEKGTISATDEWWAKKAEEKTQFKAFEDEGIEPELEHKMEQMFGGSIAQGANKFTPGMLDKETLYETSSTGFNIDGVDFDNPLSASNVRLDTQAELEWQEIWNESSPNSSHSPSPNLNKQVERRGSKRAFDYSGASGSNKSSKVKPSKIVGRATLLLERIDTMVQVVMDKGKKDMELMDLEA